MLFGQKEKYHCNFDIIIFFSFEIDILLLLFLNFTYKKNIFYFCHVQIN